MHVYKRNELELPLQRHRRLCENQGSNFVVKTFSCQREVNENEKKCVSCFLCI